MALGPKLLGRLTAQTFDRMAFLIRPTSLICCCRQSLIHRDSLRKARRKILAGALAFNSTMTSNESVTSSGRSDPESFKYVPLEGVERLENYRLGGYHPILVGDILHDRYRVVHKLGHGTYSTTWLCRDKTSRYVAVKVGTADSNPREVDVLNFLNPATSGLLDHPGRELIPSVQDRFILRGPNGVHPCYATAPAMCSVSGAKDGSYKRLFQADTARSLIAQLILAVDYIHVQGVVHGDLHLGNILLRLSADFDRLSVEQLYEKYGAPATEPIVRFDDQPLEPCIPSEATLPIWLGKASEEFSPREANVLLTDFGEAYSPSTECRYGSRAPIGVVPPEARFEFERGLTFSSDIWTLGCAIWAILGQRPLFEDILATDDDITAEQVDVLGRLPQDWWDKWEARHEYFSDNSEPNQGRHVRSWEDRFESHIQRPRRDAGIPTIERDEKAAVMDMLKSMLSFRPESRPKTRDMLKCEWMVKWAIPELEKSHPEIELPQNLL